MVEEPPTEEAMVATAAAMAAAAAAAEEAVAAAASARDLERQPRQQETEPQRRARLEAWEALLRPRGLHSGGGRWREVLLVEEARMQGAASAL